MQDEATSDRMIPPRSPPPAAQTHPTSPQQPLPTQPPLPARYRVDGLAGEGGMGRVYRAFDTLLGRPVAIKFLHATGPADPSREAAHEATQAAIREARATAAFHHPAFCRIIDVVPDPPRPYIVMEWIEGTDFRSAARKMPLEHRVRLLLRVADALAAAHAAGIVHRDLKPSNILIKPDGAPVVVDFGLATRDHAPGLCGGTPGYAAPEQFDRSPRTTPPTLGPAVDVYALGSMLFELITGRTPFVAPTPSELVRLAQHSDPPLPEEFNPDCPAALQKVCLAALERDPAQRFPTAREFADDLRRHLKGESVLARPTRLAALFTEQVNAQLRDLDRWAALGIVAPSERDDLRMRLHSLQRPESPWILDTRRLTSSQVAAYLGAWLALAALSIGLWNAWDALHSALRITIPAAVAATLFLMGLWLESRQRQRFALVYLAAACLAVPITLVILFRETGWLVSDAARASTTEAFARLDTSPTRPRVTRPPPDGLYNAQLLASAAGWLVAALASRARLASGAFTFLAVAAAWAACTALWLVSGGADPARDGVTAAGWALFMFPLAAAALVLGCVLSTAEERAALRLGRHRFARADAWPILVFAVTQLAVSFALIAFYRPEWALVPTLLPDPDQTTTARALAFIVSGSVLSMVCFLVGMGMADARKRIASALRWVLPSHFLAPLYILHLENAWGLERLWLILLFAFAVTLCFASVWRQWKPFLANGLVYYLVAYARLFEDRLISQSPSLLACLAAVFAALGLLLLFLAWWLPEQESFQRTAGWLSKRTSTLFAAPTPPRSGRSEHARQHPTE